MLSNRKYDWVFTVETGGHIPPHLTEGFVKNIVSHAEYGIVISWEGDAYIDVMRMPTSKEPNPRSAFHSQPRKKRPNGKS